MKLQIYHFLKYDKSISPDYYLKNYSDNTFLCFDLEDSILELDKPQNTILRKQQSRESLAYIITTNSTQLKNLNIGIRLNQLSSAEFDKDILLIAGLSKNINKLTLFLPKTESTSDIQKFQSDLKENDIQYTDIVAIIETQAGMANLPSILSKRSKRFNKIAFGHCDYNADTGAFPFYHHDSIQYWDIADAMLAAAESSEFTYINSPCLHLDDKDLFNSILQRLHAKSTSEAVGQIVLTHKQANWCRSFSPASIGGEVNFNFFSGNDTLPNEYAELLISAYESNRNGKSFSIAGNERILISPHEYLVAKKYLQYE